MKKKTEIEKDIKRKETGENIANSFDKEPQRHSEGEVELTTAEFVKRVC